MFRWRVRTSLQGAVRGERPHWAACCPPCGGKAATASRRCCEARTARLPVCLPNVRLPPFAPDCSGIAAAPSLPRGRAGRQAYLCIDGTGLSAAPLIGHRTPSSQRSVPINPVGDSAVLNAT